MSHLFSTPQTIKFFKAKIKIQKIRVIFSLILAEQKKTQQTPQLQTPQLQTPQQQTPQQTQR